MSLPAPNLDDRRFQDLVDDAKRLVQKRCPEWTDHNVSDPGVTMIELFAWMTDQLLYRLNRVPDRHYVKFLDLLGVKLFPATAAKVPVTFWLSAPQEETVTIPAGAETATPRTPTDEAIVFATVEELRILAAEVNEVRSTIGDKTTRAHQDSLDKAEPFYCFDKVPKPGDALLIGMSDAVPACAVTLRFDCQVEGIGVDPTNPPLAWEAWDGSGWSACEVDADGTGGLNRAGDLVVHVPRTHVASLIDNIRAGWLRARVVEASPGQPTYSASPSIRRLTGFISGGTTDAVNAETVVGEVLGFSEGVPGQRFTLQRKPVIPSDTPDVLEVSDPEATDDGGWVAWTLVEDFAASRPDDPHFTIDPAAGEIVFGPAVRLADGELRQYAAVPPKGSALRLRAYRTGGGRRGNVSRKTVTVLKSSIPYVARVENRRAARGGRDGEDMDNLKQRGPVLLRTRNRAVTAEDYEEIARETALEAARVRCVAAEDQADVGAVRVLVVPSVPDDGGRLRFEQLVPDESTLQHIAAELDERRVIGARVVVEPPVYQGITIVARVRARAQANPVTLQAEALEALYRYFSPLTGGPDRDGWPFGRPVQVGEVYSVLQRLPGVDLVEDARLFAADPVSGERGDQTARVEIDPHALIFSYGHQVLVQ